MYFLSGSSSKSIGGQLLDAVRREREDLAEVRVADERDVPELVPDRQALARLLGREDVLELLEAHRRAVAEEHVDVRRASAGRAGCLQPRHVLGREHRGVGVERVARGLVVVRVVHAPGDGGVVVAEDRHLGDLAHEVGALVRRAAVADGVAEAVVDVDLLGAIRLEHRAQRLVVGVDVAEDAEAHGIDLLPYHDKSRATPLVMGTGMNGSNGSGKLPPDSEETPDEAPPPENVLELAASCVRFVAQKYNVALDFTPDTLPMVDQYVRDAQKEISARPETMAVLAATVGAYLGEVMRREFGAFWFAEGDYAAWRLYFTHVYLACNPLGMVLEALDARRGRRAGTRTSRSIRATRTSWRSGSRSCRRSRPSCSRCRRRGSKRSRSSSKRCARTWNRRTPATFVSGPTTTAELSPIHRRFSGARRPRGAVDATR